MLRRNASSLYDRFSYLGLTSGSDPLLYYIITTYATWDTDGTWVSVISYLDGPPGSSNLYTTSFLVYKVAENGTITEIQFPDRKNRNFCATRFLSDGSIIGISPDSPGYQSVAGLQTLRLINGTWTVVDTFNFGAALYTAGGYNDREIRATQEIFALTDTTFIGTDGAKMFIFKRQENGTWARNSTFNVRSGRPSTISWNGDDVILVGLALENRFVLYQRAPNGTWDGSVVVAPSDVGYTNVLQFAMKSVAINRDTFLVLAPEAIDAASDQSGRILVVKRLGAQWYFTGQIVAPLTKFSGTFSRYTLAVSDTEVLFSNNQSLYATPLCVFQEAEYECLDQLSLDNCDFNQFSASLVCTSSQPDCSRAITTVVNSVNFNNDTVTIDYTMMPFLSGTQSRSVTITCGKTDGAPETPSAAPSTMAPGVVPIASGVPVNSPSDAGLTSGSSRGFITFSYRVMVMVFFIVSYLN